ncbi:hypothetical protein C7M84_024862 [Penaeus vannamei]|uniref:DNA mismatch repair proteins mutS family domain-containing protein n=1 Tax=Penaeus vannamei TaxID=6689 RepID=A0A3R7QXI1_PENVA|nr:hypothetical protein C7M84_024862 [Penaeus vannamei]
MPHTTIPTRTTIRYTHMPIIRRIPHTFIPTREVGVIAVLAQIGCWVPAARARLRPFDVILAVTQSTPAVTSSLSAFMLDLTRMCGALARATRHSLVIIDEFGAATYENDGAALLTACLDHWAERARVRPPGTSSSPSSPSSSQGPDEGLQGREGREGRDPLGAPPHVFVSTHLLQVYDHLQHPEAVRCLVLEAVEEGGSVVPLYQVAEGRARKSYAAVVAAIAGVPQHVVDRANQVCECIRAGRLPRAGPLLDDDEEERRRCEEIVSLVLAFDPSSDAVDLLLERIRDIGNVSKKVLDATPSSSSSSFRNETPRTSDVTPRFDLVETVMNTLGSGPSVGSSARNTPERDADRTESQEIPEELRQSGQTGQRQTASFSSTEITNNGHGAENPSSSSSSPVVSPAVSPFVRSVSSPARATPDSSPLSFKVRLPAPPTTPVVSPRPSGRGRQYHRQPPLVQVPSAHPPPVSHVLSPCRQLRRTYPRRQPCRQPSSPSTAPPPTNPVGQPLPSAESPVPPSAPSSGPSPPPPSVTSPAPSSPISSTTVSPLRQRPSQPNHQSHLQPLVTHAVSHVSSPADSPVVVSPTSATITDLRNREDADKPTETQEDEDKPRTEERNLDEDRTPSDNRQAEAPPSGSPHSSLQQTTEGTFSQESHGDESSNSSCGRESVVIQRRASRKSALLSQPSQTQSFRVNSLSFLAFLGSGSSKS